MASIAGFNSDSIQTLFSGFSTNRGNSSGSSNFLGISLSDYATIRSGSYYKLLKATYAKEAEEASSESSKTDSKSKVASMAKIRKDADSVKDSAEALLEKGTKSVFKEVTKIDENGKKTTGYDTDAIYKKVSEFVDGYNSLIKSAGSSNASGIATSAASMVNMTRVHEKMLNSIGIELNKKDHTLTIDEDAFKGADMSKVKTLFNDRGSFGYQMSVQASKIDYYAQNESSRANTYNNFGSYGRSYSQGSLFDSLT